MQRAIEIPPSSRISMAGLRARYPDASAISLQAVMNRTYLVVTTPAGRHLVNPESGDVESPLDHETARDIALFHFNGDAAIRVISLITADPPREIGPRRLPLWRVDFNDRFNTSFYIDPYTGTLVTRRHRYWRIFDFFFMLPVSCANHRSACRCANSARSNFDRSVRPCLCWPPYYAISHNIDALWFL